MHKNQILTSLYVEPQTVSARWRALVRRCIRELNHDKGIDYVPTVSEQLLRLLRNVIEVAGGAQGQGLSDEELLKKLREIVEHSLEFQRTVGEDVASTLFVMFYPLPGSSFTSDEMEDLDDGGRGKSKISRDGTKILCATDLGLKRREKASDSSGKERTQEVVLLKAKTMLPYGRR